MKRILSILLIIATLAISVFSLGTVNVVASGASSKRVYYPINYSGELKKAYIPQTVSGDCAVTSMATIEAYMFGVKDTNEKVLFKKDVVSINQAAAYAYWSRCGYTVKTNSSGMLEDLYNSLAAGYPCIVHRTGSPQHWAVVSGYVGSSEKLEISGFLVNDVAHTTQTTVYALNVWAKLSGGNLDGRYAIRKSGTSMFFRGMDFAVNHPPIVKMTGGNFSPLGKIGSVSTITSATVGVYKYSDKTTVFAKTLKPNSAICDLDSFNQYMSFIGLPAGDYIYRISATNSLGTQIYEYPFRVSATYPTTAPTFQQKAYKFYVVLDGNPVLISEAATNGKCTLAVGSGDVTNAIYNSIISKYSDFNVKRISDNRWYTTNSSSWCEEKTISAQSYTKKAYSTNSLISGLNIDSSWIFGACTADSFYFYPKTQLAYVTSISIKNMPSKTVYNVGDTLNTAGLILSVKYSDGTTKDVTSDFYCTPMLLEDKGQQTITVTFGGSTTTFPVNVNELATDEPRIIVSNAVKNKDGTYDVAISLENNPGITGITLDVSYDSSVLALAKIESTNLMTNAFFVTSPNILANPQRLTWTVGTLDIKENGVIVKLNFKVIDPEAAGTYEIKATCDKEYSFNLDFENIKFLDGSGNVIIADYLPGDVDGDNKITPKDATLVLQSFARWDVLLNVAAADVNGDGVITPKDATMILQKFAGWDVVFKN